MDMKQYMRGLGAGLIFSSAVLMVTSAVAGDSEKTQDTQQQTTTTSVIAYTTVASTTESAEQTTMTASEQASTTVAETTVAETQPETTAATTAQTQPETTQAIVDSNGVARVTFHNVYYATQAAALLKDAGVISDSQGFVDYLVSYGYASKIREGEYSIQQGASYDTIAKIITQMN